MTKISRRGFMVGCSAAIAAMAGSRISYAAFGNAADEPDQQILVTVFLRGGCDALNFIPPIGGEDRKYYEVARPDLKIPVGAALPLGCEFGLHPAAAPLHELYQAGKLAIVQAAGMNEDTRSHFDAMTYIELGTPGQKSSTTGWLTRHLQTVHLPGGTAMPSLTAGALTPTSLSGYVDNVAMNKASDFNLNIGPRNWRDKQQTVLRQLYGASDTLLHDAGIQALDAVDTIGAGSTDYSPANGAAYPSGSFGDRLKTVAQIIKLQLGLKVATVDLGGWDTHENQTSYGDSTKGHYADLVQQLSQGLHALYTDLDSGYTHRLTVVVMSEFGRRLRENNNLGCDHGHGGMMLLLGGNLNGGLHGFWPGLHSDQLYDRGDLDVTTDYRLVLSELLTTKLGNPNISAVFPGYSYGDFQPLNIFNTAGASSVTNASGNKTYLPLVTAGEVSC